MSWSFKFSLLLILSAICLAVGSWSGVFADATVVEWIRYFGYYAILASTLIWLWGLYRAYPGAFKPQGWSWLGDKRFRWAIVAVLVVFAAMQLNEQKGFKILLDEPVLINTSRMMHYERQVYVVSNSQRVEGILAAKGYVDKRPNFFPFLVSVVHDLTGYRIENAFYLNTVLLLVLLGLAFSVGRELSSNMAGGFISLGAVASLPLVWHQAAGGGFEILNLVMMLLTLKLAIDYLKNPSSQKLTALALTAVMFAQVRYESILFVIPVAIVGIMGYSIHRKPMLPWGVWISPLLLVPVLWQQRVFNLTKDFWELFTVGTDKPFSLDYYAHGVSQALFFFFSWSWEMPTAPLVAWVGGISLVVFIIVMCLRLVEHQKRAEIIDSKRAQLVFFTLLLGVGLYFTLLMCYAFDLGQYMVQRLALPLYLTMALGAAIVCGDWIRGRWWYRGVAVVLLGGLVAWTVPCASSQHYASLYFPEIEAQQVDRFVHEHLDRGERFLMVADMSMLWTSYDIETIPFRALNNEMPSVKYFLENPNNIPIYVVQSLEYNPVTRRFEDTSSEQLSARAILKPFWSRAIGSFRMLRISRLMDLEGVDPVDDTGVFTPGDPENLSHWVRMLP
jgi:hypothetical protein